MTPWGCIAVGWGTGVSGAIVFVAGLAAGHDSADAMWLLVGAGGVLAAVAPPFMVIGAVAQGVRVVRSLDRPSPY